MERISIGAIVFSAIMLPLGTPVAAESVSNSAPSPGEIHRFDVTASDDRQAERVFAELRAGRVNRVLFTGSAAKAFTPAALRKLVLLIGSRGNVKSFSRSEELRKDGYLILAYTVNGTKGETDFILVLNEKGKYAGLRVR